MEAKKKYCLRKNTSLEPRLRESAQVIVNVGNFCDGSSAEEPVQVEIATNCWKGRIIFSPTSFPVFFPWNMEREKPWERDWIFCLICKRRSSSVLLLAEIWKVEYLLIAEKWAGILDDSHTLVKAFSYTMTEVVHSENYWVPSLKRSPRDVIFLG